MPHFTSIDLDLKHDFKPMLTDVGLCHVYNGNSISQTFVDAGRNSHLKHAFEQINSHPYVSKIIGTRFQHQKTFWFDVGIRLLLKFVELPKE